jgi:hypothetical protein
MSPKPPSPLPSPTRGEGDKRKMKGKNNKCAVKSLPPSLSQREEKKSVD